MHKYVVKTSGDVSLTAATAKTLLQIVTPSSRRARITGFTVSFSSVTATDAPALIEFLLQTTAGTASAVTPTAIDQADPAALTTAQDTVTAEPTASTILRTIRLTPIGGLIVYDFMPDDQIEMLISTRVGMRVTSPAAQSAVRAEVVVQE